MSAQQQPTPLGVKECMERITEMARTAKQSQMRAVMATDQSERAYWLTSAAEWHKMAAFWASEAARQIQDGNL